VTDKNNLSIWKSVEKTDPTYTKAFTQNGGGTAINGTYTEMRATEIFGPKGIGWGVKVVEERFDKGAPIMQKVKDSAGVEVNQVIPDGSGGVVCEVNHTVRITLWFIQDGQRGEIEAYGCTPYITKNKYGLSTDGEAPKKSLTDAMKKALSGLGFSADIFLGMYDIGAYVDEARAEFSAKSEISAIEDKQKVFDEFMEKLKRNADTLAAAGTKTEVNSLLRTILLSITTNLRVFGGDQEKSGMLNAVSARMQNVADKRLAELVEMKKVKADGENS
jgi:hypothetical protein